MEIAKMAHVVPCYNIMLRLGGHEDPIALHEIPMRGVTMKEITLLKNRHGPSAVHSVKEDGAREFPSEQVELYNLARKYASNAQDMAEQGVIVGIIAKLFNADMSGFESWLVDEHDMEEAIREESNQRRQAQQRERAIAQMKAELDQLEKA